MAFGRSRVGAQASVNEPTMGGYERIANHLNQA
jgi:hypothetical protein